MRGVNSLYMHDSSKQQLICESSVLTLTIVVVVVIVRTFVAASDTLLPRVVQFVYNTWPWP